MASKIIILSGVLVLMTYFTVHADIITKRSADPQMFGFPGFGSSFSQIGQQNDAIRNQIQSQMEQMRQQSQQFFESANALNPFANMNPSENTQNDPFSSMNPSFGAQNDPFSNMNPSFGAQNDPFSSMNPSSGAQNDPFSSMNPSFGAQNDPFSSMNPSFGTQNDPFASMNPSLSTLFSSRNGFDDASNNLNPYSTSQSYGPGNGGFAYGMGQSGSNGMSGSGMTGSSFGSSFSDSSQSGGGNQYSSSTSSRTVTEIGPNGEPVTYKEVTIRTTKNGKTTTRVIREH